MTIGQRLLVPFYQSAQQRSTSDAAHRSKTRLEQPKILACSASRNEKLLFSLQELDRKLCEDRKAPLEHLYPGNLSKSTFRIVVTQGSFIVSTYANDQLQQEMAREDLVREGKMTQEEADEAAEEWENREWKARWESFPGRLTDALIKYHAIVLVMRLYEYIAAKFVDKVALDALTIDTFKSAKRIDSAERSRVEVGRQMFSICAVGNVVAFLADYSVHQLIIGFGYYTYLRERRKKRQLRLENARVGESDDDESEKHPFLKQSASLMLSRSLGLFFTACGGAAGSMILPGWGTVIGSNMGDSLGGVVSDSPKILS